MSAEESNKQNINLGEVRMKEWREFSEQAIQTEKLKKLKMGISPDTKYEYWHMCLLKECACAEDTPPTDRLLTKSEIEKHLETSHEINFKNIGSNWDINLFEILILYEETNVVADNIDISTLTNLMKSWDESGKRADTCFVCLGPNCNFEKDSIPGYELKTKAEKHRNRHHKTVGDMILIKIFYQKTSLKDLDPESCERIESLPSLMSIPIAEPPTVVIPVEDETLHEISPQPEEGRSALRVLAQRISEIIDHKREESEKQNLPKKDFNLYWHLCVIDECSSKPLSFDRLMTFDEFYGHVKVHGIEDADTYDEKVIMFGVAILHSGTETSTASGISPLLSLRKKWMENLADQASLEPGKESRDFESCLMCLIEGCPVYSYVQPEELNKQLTEHSNYHSREKTGTTIKHFHVWIMDKTTESAPSIATSEASSAAVSPAERDILSEHESEVTSYRHSSGSESSEKQKSEKMEQELSGKTPSEEQPDAGQTEKAPSTVVGPSKREIPSGEVLQATSYGQFTDSESDEKQESEKPKQAFFGKTPSEEHPDAGQTEKAPPTAVGPAERKIPSAEALEVTLYGHSSGPEPSEKQKSEKTKQEFSQKTLSEEQPDTGRTEKASSTALGPAGREILSAEDLQVTSYEPFSGSESSAKEKSEKRKQEFSGETPSEEQPDAGQKKKASSTEVGPAGREIPSGEVLEVTSYRHSSGSESSKKQKSEKPKKEFSGKTLSEEHPDVGQTEKASPTAVRPSEKEIVSGEVLEVTSYGHSSGSESSDKQKSEKRKQEFSGETPSAKQRDAGQRGKASSTAVGPAARQLLSGEDLQVTSYTHSSGSKPSEKQESRKRKQEFSGKSPSEEQPNPKQRKKASSTAVGPAERDIRSREALQVTSYGPSSGSKSSKKRRKKERRKQKFLGKTPSAEQPDVAQRESFGTSSSRQTTILKCKLCNCEVEVLTNSESHRLIALKKDDFTCGLCDRPIQTRKGAEAPENVSICEICNKQTEDLTNHLSREHNVELVQYECIRCQMKFADGSRLKNHMNEFH